MMLLQSVSLSFKYYYRNIASILLSIALPLLFLFIYSLGFNLNNIESSIEIYSSDKELVTKLVDNGKIAHESDKPVVGLNKYYISASESGYMIIGDAYNKVAVGIVKNSLLTIGSTSSTIINVLDEGSYSRFGFIGGIVILIILQVALFSTAMKVVEEKGTKILRLLSHNKRFYMNFVSELIAKSVIILFISSILLFSAERLYPLEITTELVLNYYLYTFISALVLITLGYALGIYVAEKEDALQIINVSNLILLLSGNIIFPVSLAPALEIIFSFSPTANLSNVFTKQVFQAQGFQSTLSGFISISIWLIVATLVIIRRSK